VGQHSRSRDTIAPVGIVLNSWTVKTYSKVETQTTEYRAAERARNAELRRKLENQTPEEIEQDRLETEAFFRENPDFLKQG